MGGGTQRVFDEYLLLAIRAGDRRATDVLVRRWHRKLLAHAWRLLGDAEAARDVVQESWIEIMRGLSGLRDDNAFPAWAYRIVTRRCAKSIGTKVRDRQLAASAEHEPVVVADPEAPARDHDRLRIAIRSLPEEQRAAIALFHFEELSVAEVAVALDVPVGTVKTRLMHARRKLRSALGGEE